MKTTNQTPIQLARFPDGGFVLHKIPGSLFSGHFSAWFDAKGTLLDCEQVLPNGQTRSVKPNAGAWNFLRNRGFRYVVKG